MTITTHAATLALALIVAVAAGCARGEPEPAGQGGEPGAGTSPGPGAPAEGGAADGLVAGTPAGGLERWIAEIRSGVDTLPALAARDAAAAKNQALLLYVTRQEYIEIYYGNVGRAVKDSSLAESVMTAETRFHELLQVANPPAGAIDGAALRKAAGALAAQYDRVLERARELDLDLGQLRLAPGGSN